MARIVAIIPNMYFRYAFEMFVGFGEWTTLAIRRGPLEILSRRRRRRDGTAKKVRNLFLPVGRVLNWPDVRSRSFTIIVCRNTRRVGKVYGNSERPPRDVTGAKFQTDFNVLKLR